MIFRNWKDATKHLREATSGATEQQLALAAHLHRRLPKSTPQLVAAAKIRFWLQREILVSIPDVESPEWLINRIAALSRALGMTRPPSPSHKDEATAWLAHLDLRTNMIALKRLKLVENDVVSHQGRNQLVSSIDTDGRVWFKGGRGARAWPTDLSRPKIADVEHARSEVESRIAAAAPADISAQRLTDLQDWQVSRNEVHAEQIEMLRSVIDEASDEKPIQRFLEANRELLALLLRGPHSYVKGEPSLGGKFFPDFAIGDVDSNGFRWVLIELETPSSGTALKTTRDFDRYARKGLSQIAEWRMWLRKDLKLAQEYRSEGGVGLAGIGPSPDGLLIVGRRDRLERYAPDLRNAKWEESRIKVMTYDRLLEHLEGSLALTNLPSHNPFILPRKATL